jgi:hypothetical protein
MRRAAVAAGLVLTAAAGLGLGACGGGGGSETTTTARTTTVVETTTVAPQTTVPGTDNGGAIGSQSATGVIRPFAANSPWNTSILTTPADGQSERYMQFARERVGVVEGQNDATLTTKTRVLNDPVFINTTKWTVPVVDETNAVPTRVVCRQPPLQPNDDFCGDGWSVPSLQIPSDVDPHPEFDGWFTVLNRREAVAYDLWRARRSRDGGTISYQFMRKWDLNGPGFLVPGAVSARGSGLPLFAGLILPEEIRAGRIDHALAMSVPGPAQRVYVQPASATDGNGRLESLPEGARIRLKAGVSIDSVQRRYVDARCDDPLFGLRTNRRDALCRRYDFPSRTNRRAAVAIYRALRRYGAIIVDRARVPTLYAKFNADWRNVLRNDQGDLLDSNGAPFPVTRNGRVHHGTPLLRGNEVQGLTLNDFEVVRLPPTLRFPNLGTLTNQQLNGVTGQAPVPAPVPRRTAPRTTTTGQQTFRPSGGTGGGG